ncbi:hypothetical protein P5G51_004710 [Virgibacillus sp. 179-BFC.A HS]|uniref:Uncharacterized protein n=1 Tax=Tigheibacillus jepli TaxID=3035914 RepID=A0ABU5CEN0_9BACI|nr:hypothetical protein [Virgibacillus sp. 179-BFC.A HS]MDY0404793.1 hypothetical protein [Virgibacillus sp. 179-BFC.A HS]
MSCQLPSVIGAGVGQFVNNKKISTDGSEFTGSVGIIAKKVSILKDVLGCVLGDELQADPKRNVKIVIPKKGSIHCPDGMDMHDRIMNHLTKLDCSDYTFEEIDMAGIDDRRIGISTIEKCLKDVNADLILTMEGPVDVYGYGETIPQYFGNIGIDLTKNHGKYLLRAANMCHATAVTVPTSMLASGILIIAKGGAKHAGYAFDLARKFEESIKLPEVWKRCFLEEQQYTGINFNQYDPVDSDFLDISTRRDV